MITRQQFMRKEASFADYYRELATACGIRFEPNDPFLDRVRAALADGDEPLNSIPLREWDAMHGPHTAWWIQRHFKDRGDVPSPAGMVCMYKAAARAAAGEEG